MTTASELRSGKTHRDENFPVASWIIHPRHRALILAFYNFVRTADDIADHATLAPAEKLAHLKDDLWTKTTLYVVDRRVVLVNPETGIPQEVVTGQYLLGIPLTRVISDTSENRIIVR